ncbi:MAG: DUF1015 domain-containing protein [Propionibacteriaceae bacterium]|jgi:uncharacterized protein (DUF1015 family)|nr:DUF1015 domain-containing protein [Propionibacteriaceae bacterium]
MPDFRPFPALRFANDIDLKTALAPPYDVLTDEDARALQESAPYNITWIDVPFGDYDKAAETLWKWVQDGVLSSDISDTLSIYRMAFTDAPGTPREIVGVLGGLEVVDEGAGGVLPHERTTPKAKSDRLDLTRATSTNMSPVWGLSLAGGLTEELREPGTPEGSVTFDGVKHTVEKISDPARIERIRAILASDDVLIADGHHRYAVSRTYRDEVRSATGSHKTQAEYTLTFVNELIEDQLSIEAIHRLYEGLSADALRGALSKWFVLEPFDGSVTPGTLAEMESLGRLVILWPDGTAGWLVPKPGVFDDVRPLDGLWLETALADVPHEVSYQHGLAETLGEVASGNYTAGILIRPTSIAEIRRTAREGLLMPPKSTFFTPKLLTGWVLRPTATLPGQ